ncbi:MAG: NADH:flavin oxidoreductase, partial [Gammaproteobacteria bacterium]|nr:NADH:flavin oxidoreductase [Gammaproteobacteria bacterium]
FDGCELDSVFSVESILDGKIPSGSVLIYDDDHYYLGWAIALKLREAGLAVTMVTPEARIGGWTSYTEEQTQHMQTLIAADVTMLSDKGLDGWDGKVAQLECVFSGNVIEVEAGCLIPLTARLPEDSLWLSLQTDKDKFKSLQRIGDCAAPGIIAAAVYSGHKAARELGEAESRNDLRRDRIVATTLEPFV